MFDGVCVLCDRSIQFLLKIDRRKILKFTHLQSKTAKSIINRHPIIKSGGQSVIFVVNFGNANETIFLRSDAISRIFKTIGGKWQIVSWLKLIPRIIRDPFYNWLAKNRYKWFGKYNECRLPNSEWQKRFLP